MVVPLDRNRLPVVARVGEGVDIPVGPEEAAHQNLAVQPSLAPPWHRTDSGHQANQSDVDRHWEPRAVPEATVLEALSQAIRHLDLLAPQAAARNLVVPTPLAATAGARLDRVVAEAAEQRRLALVLRRLQRATALRTRGRTC